MFQYSYSATILQLLGVGLRPQTLLPDSAPRPLSESPLLDTVLRPWWLIGFAYTEGGFEIQPPFEDIFI